MINFILDLLFPIHCLGCSKENCQGFICPICFKQIPLNKKLPLKSNDKGNLTGLIVASYYNYPLVKQAVHRYKYDFIKDLSKPLGQLMVKRLNRFSDFLDKDNSILIPVPLHKKRLRWRGFNQAELLAIEIGKQLNIPVVNNLLIRTKYSIPQVKIKTSSERQQNIKHAFSLSSNQGQSLKLHPFAKGCNFKDCPCVNKTIILIDDIATTSATLKECAKALNPLRPKEIWGLVIAKG